MDENTRAIVASRLVVAIAIQKGRWKLPDGTTQTAEAFAQDAVEEFKRVYDLLGSASNGTQTDTSIK